ncbi:hypothetical protein EV426DRAFT_70847 [Tirmania nivea]|nr:hypothetical protein EV426DRAFT_70847 [Tirmania nivea]
MKFNALAASTALILFTGTAIALPQPVAKTQPAPPQPGLNIFSRQAITPDGTCGTQEAGAGNGFRCPPAQYQCCSQWGWCGDTAEHCGTGCQSAYGSCTGGTTLPPRTSSPPSSSGTRPQLGNVPYGIRLNTCTVPGTVALTYDDGPYIYMQRLLDILNGEDVKATFFLNGENWGPAITVDSNAQQVIRNAYNTGHQIASHTWSHPDLDTLSVNDITSQMSQLESALLSIIGRYPTYMRPPYLNCGATCLSTLNTLGYHVMITNLDTRDWQYNTPSTNWQSQQIFNNAISSTSGTSGSWLVLAHSNHETSVELLTGYMIDRARSQGYRFVTVGECMDDPPANWYRTTL